MKTIQISEGLWKRLKLESVERGVPMRDVVEAMGAAWTRATPRTVSESAVPTPPVRELRVELDE